MKTKPILSIICILIISLTAYTIYFFETHARHGAGIANNENTDSDTKHQPSNDAIPQSDVPDKNNLKSFIMNARNSNPNATPEELNELLLQEIRRRAAERTPEQIDEMRLKAREKAIASVDRLRKARKQNMDKDYADLFMRLRLSAGDMDTLKNLIVNLEFAGRDAWLDPRFSQHQPNPSRQDVEAVAAEYTQSYKNEIYNLIGDENIDMFNHYLDTLPARRACDVITARFAYEAEPLTSTTRENLIDIIYESNNAFKASGILSDVYSIARFEFLKEKTIELSQAVLTPSQLQSIENYYNDTIKSRKDERQVTQDWGEKQRSNNASPQQ